MTREEILGRAIGGEGLRGANLVRADLSATDMSRTDLVEANFRMADLSRADLTESQLSGAFLSGACLSGAVLVGANLVEASIIGAIMDGADLSRADLSGADLTGANLRKARLVGAYLVGTFLNETDLGGANLNGSYIRMAQMAGCNLAVASLEGADVSNANLSGVRLDDCCLVNANLTGANLSASVLKGADLRGADLTDADLTGCNLTGAKLNGIKFSGVKLADAWAEWVDLSPSGNDDERSSLEDAFVGIVGKPLAELLVEGSVGDEVWAAVLEHLCEFRNSNSVHRDITLRAIHQGIRSSALYLEAEHEVSLAAYLAELADLLGKGSLELFDKLAVVVGSKNESNGHEPSLTSDVPPDSLPGVASSNGDARSSQESGSASVSRIESLRQTPFWSAEKAIAILTGNRQVWLEVSSNESLTLRPPHGAAMGIDLVGGRFITEDIRGRRK